MCGIAGYIERPASLSKTDTLDNMLNRLVHRGPDGSGAATFSGNEWRVHLGHRRLSIIDIEGGRQPMLDSSKKTAITFNGEIVNFQNLRTTLLENQYSFQSRSDTEVVLKWLDFKGTDGIKDLNGMFAFAYWDEKREELFLCRDRSGIKPLYYASLPDGGIAFASELTALLQHPRIASRLNAASMASYFFYDYIPAPLTAIEGIFKLEPGHSVVWKKGKLAPPKPFWRLNLQQSSEKSFSLSQLEQMLEEKLTAAMDRQMVSDVPVGVFLSGGLDSSVVAALAQKTRKEPIQTFSIAFEDKTFDESAFARIVAKHIGSMHREKALREQDIVGEAGRALATLDEPLADPSLVPTYLLSEFAARHVKVALGGDGGDELWAGYPTYKVSQWADFWGYVPSPLRGAWNLFLSQFTPREKYQSWEWKAKRFFHRWDSNPALRHLRWMSSSDLPEIAQLLGNTPVQGPRVPKFGETSDRLQLLLALDFASYLPGSVLTKVDRASMAHGLEVRPPLLDNELIDWAFSLPSSVKLCKNRSKFLLTRIARHVLPPEILSRKKKGFGIPLAKWLRGPLSGLVTNALSDSPLWEAGKNGPIRRETFLRWQVEHSERTHDRSKPLWALVVLDSWVKREGIQVGTGATSQGLNPFPKAA